MKGQFVTLEHVFFFVIGVVMTIVIYYAFSGIADSIEKIGVHYQLLRVAEALRWQLTSIYLAGNETGARIEVTAEIPVQVSGCVYGIKKGLVVFCEETGESVEAFVPFPLEIKNEIIYSSSGRINITYEEGRLWME